MDMAFIITPRFDQYDTPFKEIVFFDKAINLYQGNVNNPTWHGIIKTT